MTALSDWKWLATSLRLYPIATSSQVLPLGQVVESWCAALPAVHAMSVTGLVASHTRVADVSLDSFLSPF